MSLMNAARPQKQEHAIRGCQSRKCSVLASNWIWAGSSGGTLDMDHVIHSQWRLIRHAPSPGPCERTVWRLHPKPGVKKLLCFAAMLHRKPALASSSNPTVDFPMRPWSCVAFVLWKLTVTLSCDRFVALAQTRSRCTACSHHCFLPEKSVAQLSYVSPVCIVSLCALTCYRLGTLVCPQLRQSSSAPSHPTSCLACIASKRRQTLGSVFPDGASPQQPSAS